MCVVQTTKVWELWLLDWETSIAACKGYILYGHTGLFEVGVDNRARRTAHLTVRNRAISNPSGCNGGKEVVVSMFRSSQSVIVMIRYDVY